MKSAISENNDVIVQNDLGRKRAIIKVGNGCESMVELPTGVWNYGAIVSALVRAKYSADEVEAILNNNIALITSPSSVSEETGQEQINEFSQLQDWREKCKTRAKELLGIGEEMGLIISYF